MNTDKSALRDALERIEAWYLKNQNPLDSYLQPGLSLREIKKVEKELGFYFPHELCELYHWHNGIYYGDELLRLPGISFLSLESAFDLYSDMVISRSSDNEADVDWYDPEIDFLKCYWEERWFPLSVYEEGYYFVELSEERKKSSAVFSITVEDDLEPGIVYPSLTDMVSEAAKEYEEGIYSIAETGGIRDKRDRYVRLVR